jgi:hypothetical protein
MRPERVTHGRASASWRRLPHRHWIATGLAAAAFLAAVAVSPAVRHELALSFTRLPVGFTELYFTGPRTRPVLAPDGRAQVRVTFGIGRRGEPDDFRYTYSVAVLGTDGALLAERTAAVLVPAGGHRDLDVSVDLPVPVPYGSVDVRLLGRPEHIRARAPVPGGGP